MPQKPRQPRPNLLGRKDRPPGLPTWDSGRSPIAAWRDGVVLPLIPALLGLVPLATGHFEARTRGSRLVLDGGPARALGLAAIAFGACIHFHAFWGTHPTLSSYSQPALMAGAIVFLGMVGYVAYATLL